MIELPTKFEFRPVCAGEGYLYDVDLNNCQDGKIPIVRSPRNQAYSVCGDNVLQRSTEEYIKNMIQEGLWKITTTYEYGCDPLPDIEDLI